jgi:ABC-type amino acid transport substrate-binding protein
MRSRLRLPLTALAICVGVASASAASLKEIRESGRLRVAVYADYAPFSDDGRGIDVEVGNALALKMGLTPEMVSFKDADSVDDDLRNMVWKGHYLWKGRLGDVMMHVPIDAALASKNRQVKILAPYFREQIVVARNRNRIPQLVTLEPFKSEKIGVHYNTVEDNYLLNSFAGVLRENVVHFASTLDAAAALQRNEVAAVMGRRTHIEAGLAGAAGRFEIAQVATPGLHPNGWEVGVAVKAEDPEVADAVEAAMAGLRKEGSIERIFAKRGLTYTPPATAR